MSLVGLRQAVIDSIANEMTAFRVVQAHGGRFNAQELRRVAMKAPACLVVVLGGPFNRHGGSQAVGSVQLAAFIVTSGTSDVKRDEAALILAENVSNLVTNNAWEFKDAKAPESMRMDNLHGAEIDQLGVALWVVTWTQKVDLALFNINTLDDFRSLYTQTDLAPKDGVIEDEMQIGLQGTLMSAYGKLYVSSEVATAIAVAGTYQKAAGTTTLLEAKGMDMPFNNRLRHTDDVLRPVSVQTHISVSVDADAKVSFAIAKNGVVIEESAISEDLLAAGGVEALTCGTITELKENEYIELWVTADSTVNVTVEKMALMVIAT